MSRAAGAAGASTLESYRAAACDPACDTLVVPISYDDENRLGELQCPHRGNAFLA